MEGMGTEACAIASYAGQLPNQMPWRRSSGPVRRTANRETHSCRLAPSHYGEAGAARPSSAEASLFAVGLERHEVETLTDGQLETHMERNI
jgi:hypothetical protein